MIEEQKTLIVPVSELCQKVKEYRDAGYRLVQIGATRLEGFEVNYSFDKEYQFINVRIVIASTSEAIPSISGIYWSAFLYENEIHDLFGLTITDIAVDYHGKFYHTTVKMPFNTPRQEKQEEAK